MDMNIGESQTYITAEGVSVEIPYKGVEIPQPNESDRSWAEEITTLKWSLTGTSSFRKMGKFDDAIRDNNLWRILFAINLNNKYPEDKKFLSNFNGRYAFEKALRKKQKERKEVLDILLSYNFPKRCGFTKDALKELSRRKHRDLLTELVKEEHLDLDIEDQHVLYSAAQKNDEIMCCFILNLGANYETALTHLPQNRPGFNTLRNSIKEFNSDEKKKLLEPEAKEKTLKLEHKSIEPANENMPKNTPIWEAIDDNTIIRIDNVQATKTQLQTIFNFKARNVKTIISIDNTTPAVTVENFKDIEDDSVLYEAWQKLKDNPSMNPDEFIGNKSFVVQKPSKKQDIKIEK